LIPQEKLRFSLPGIPPRREVVACDEKIAPQRIIREDDSMIPEERNSSREIQVKWGGSMRIPRGQIAVTGDSVETPHIHALRLKPAPFLQSILMFKPINFSAGF
jgi:hypothetical protein